MSAENEFLGIFVHRYWHSSASICPLRCVFHFAFTSKIGLQEICISRVCLCMASRSRRPYKDKCSAR